MNFAAACRISRGLAPDRTMTLTRFAVAAIELSREGFVMVTGPVPGDHPTRGSRQTNPQ